MNLPRMSFDFQGPMNRFRQSLILREMKTINPTGPILDAGCGDARLTVAIAEQLHRPVVGVDLSRVALDLGAKVVAASPAYPFVRLKQRSLQCLQHEYDQSYGGAACGEVMEHLEDDVAALQELRRVLRPNAPLVISVPWGKWQWDISDRLSGHRRRYSKKDLYWKLIQSGFVIDKIYHWGFPMGMIYHFLFMRPWVDCGGPELGSGKRSASKLLYWLFAVDRLFHWLPLGRGMIAVARRRPIAGEGWS